MTCADRLSASDLAGYLDGDLSAEERTRVEAHLDGCADCWADLLKVRQLRDEAFPTAPTRQHGRRPRWIWYAGLATAAGLATVVLLSGAPEVPGGAAGPVRTPSDERSSPLALKVVGPEEGSSVIQSSAVFTWHGGSAGLYRFTLLTETGEPAWTTETTDTVVRLPSYLTLQPGLYFWRVDAVQDGLAASSGIHRLRIAP